MKRFSTPVALILVAILLARCNFLEGNDSETREAQNLGLITGLALENSKEFALNGQWKIYGGDGTTQFSTDTISARDQYGAWISDAACLSRYIVVYFDNSNGIVITQNPSQGGAYNDGGTGGSCGAFSDTAKGKYNKIVFFEGQLNGQSVIWSCTIAFGKDTLVDALAAEDTASRSNPAASNSCGVGTWSRLERVTAGS